VQRIVRVGIHARVSQRALHSFEQRTLPLFERQASAVQRRLRGHDDGGDFLHVGDRLRERLRVDVSKAQSSEVGGEKLEAA